jgi:PAS domain S-box-containing protein
MTGHSEDLRGFPSLLAEPFAVQLAHLRAGAHACAINNTPAEQLHAVVTFFHAGLERDARCMYLADPVSAEQMLQSLRARGIDTNALLDRGALILVTSREAFVHDRHFDPTARLLLHQTMAAEARAQGFSRVRIAGDGNWELGDDVGTTRFFEFESRLNDIEPDMDVAFLCLYDGRGSQPEVLRDVLRIHPVVIIGEQLHDNPYYDPTIQMDAGVDLERQRVDWMLSQLQARTRREMAIASLAQLAQAGRQPADLMQAAAGWIADELRVALVQIFELLPSGDAVRTVVSLGLHQVTTGAVDMIELDSPLANDTLRSGRPLIIPDWSQETRFRQSAVLREAGIATSTSVVISVGRDAHQYGILSVHSADPRIVSDNELAFLETVATLLAQAIARVRSEASIRALVETAPDLIMRVDHDLRLAYVNPAVERAVGRLSATLIGRTSRELGTTSDGMASWEITLAQVFRTGREQSVEVTLATTSGERLFEARLTPEVGSDGTVESVLCIARDVTDRKQADEERERLYRELMEREQRLHEMVEQILLDQTVRRRRAGGAEAMQHLTKREREVLPLLGRGLTTRQIAEQLMIVPGTVKSHTERIFAKLGVTSRAQAAVRAIELGLLDEQRPPSDVPGAGSDQESEHSA